MCKPSYVYLSFCFLKSIEWVFLMLCRIISKHAVFIMQHFCLTSSYKYLFALHVDRNPHDNNTGYNQIYWISQWLVLIKESSDYQNSTYTAKLNCRRILHMENCRKKLLIKLTKFRWFRRTQMPWSNRIKLFHFTRRNHEPSNHD